MSRWPVMSLGAIAVTLFAASAWAQENSTQGTVTGTVAYRERMALPPDAAIDVRLEDVSLQDAPPRLVGESIFAAAGQQVPIAFQLSYNPADINPAHTYQL